MGAKQESILITIIVLLLMVGLSHAAIPNEERVTIVMKDGTKYISQGNGIIIKEIPRRLYKSGNFTSTTVIVGPRPPALLTDSAACGPTISNRRAFYWAELGMISFAFIMALIV